MVAGNPRQGGATWAVLQYVLGLRHLGHDVFLVEPVREFSPATVGYFQQVARRFGLTARAALVADGRRQSVGLSYRRVREAARSADLLINISGLLVAEELREAPIRVYVDLDPAFNQLWHAAEGVDVGFDGHTHFVTVGCAIGRDGCDVPTCGYEWLATLQPVVLGEWPVANGFHHDALTTVGNWRAYGSIDHDGVFYGQKAHALRELIDLPLMTDERFLLALAIHPNEPDLSALHENGWELVNPAEVAGTPHTYRRFIQGSKAEFGIAKSGYVRSRCGWFSDRSACYLASGRPVLAQETGFSRFLPVGEGLFAFTTAGDVLAAIDEIRADYSRHARAARELAEAFFGSELVLTRLLDRVGAGAYPRA
jgi:hypothetical protein